jgi:hypothetical protein
MMTIEMMRKILDNLGEDVYYTFNEKENLFEVDIKDFAGFDEDWSEHFRKYDNPQAVEDFEKMLEKECISFDGDFYVQYEFEGFTVELGYTSMDI